MSYVINIHNKNERESFRRLNRVYTVILYHRLKATSFDQIPACVRIPVAPGSCALRAAGPCDPSLF